MTKPASKAPPPKPPPRTAAKKTDARPQLSNNTVRDCAATLNLLKKGNTLLQKIKGNLDQMNDKELPRHSRYCKKHIIDLNKQLGETINKVESTVKTLPLMGGMNYVLNRNGDTCFSTFIRFCTRRC